MFHFQAGNTQDKETDENKRTSARQNASPMFQETPPKFNTKVSKFTYEPQTYKPSQAVLKSIHTYNRSKAIMQKRDTAMDTEHSAKSSHFQLRDINRNYDENQSNTDSKVNSPTINSNNEFLRKKLEREKDIEEIQNMLNQINTSCHTDSPEKSKFQSNKTEISNDNSNPINFTFETIESPEKLQENIPKNSPQYSNNSNNNVVLEESPKINKNNFQTVSPKYWNANFKSNESSPKNLNKTVEFQSSRKTQENIKRNLSEVNLHLNISPTKTLASTTARSKSSTNLSVPPSTETTTRKKHYDPNDARQFIKKQRETRKAAVSVQKTAAASALDKEAIKKRLEDLRQNTTKIIAKNVQIAKKRKIQPKKEPEMNAISPQKSRRVDSSARHNSPTTSTKEILKPSNSKRILKLEKKPHLDDILNKKIGLLRKPENANRSFSAIKDYDINKENINLDFITPKSQQSQISSQVVKQISDTVLYKKIPENHNEQPEMSRTNEELVPPSKLNEMPSIEDKSSTKITQKPLNGGDSMLKVPELKLQSKISLREKSIQVEEENSQKLQDKIPYWLKPTPVQIYPYNFIMAVRKKLEAITNPVITDKRKQETKEIPGKFSETPLAHPKNRKENVRRRIVNEKIESTNESSNTKSDNNFIAEKLVEKKINKNNDAISKSLSELTSNFSSISINVPVAASNTASDFSSIHSDIVACSSIKKDRKSGNSQSIHSNDKIKQIQKKLILKNDDDTTISSSVFSSPEKKTKIFDRKKLNLDEIEAEDEKILEIFNFNGPLSPLETDNIKNMQVQSKSNLNKSENFVVPRNESMINEFERKIPQGAKNKRRNSENTVDLSRLLEDFNKSLSQVIEVNEQLKVTLNKSQQIISPSRKLQRNPLSIQSKTDEYTSDFEEELSKTFTSVKEVAIKTDDPMPSSMSTKHKLHLNNTLESIKSISTVTETDSHKKSSKKSTSKKSSSSEYSGTKSISEHILQTENKILNDDCDESKSLHESISNRKEFIQHHINNSRGDFIDSIDDEFKEAEKSHTSLQSPIESNQNLIQNMPNSATGPPPAYDNVSNAKNDYDSSHNSEFIAVFNRSDIEISMFSQNESSATEATLNYSSIGMYEQLLQNEASKSEQLAALLKMREKALIDRTRGQIAWLEVQKEKYRAKGLSDQISAIKKKQRAILMKMEKEREEIKKLIHSKQSQTSLAKDHHHHPDHQATYRPKLIENLSDIELRKSLIATNRSKTTSSTTTRTIKSNTIVRGFEVQKSRNLEIILRRREEELRKRRLHVQRLMEWHQRLDKEEQEVLQLEKMLFENNVVQQQQQQQQQHQQAENSSESELLINESKKERKLLEINKSLKKLENISQLNDTENSNADYVRITGHKLNKLWRRLTGQKNFQKFDEIKRYKLFKSDLENFYDQAKKSILREFDENQKGVMDFFDRTNLDRTTTSAISSSDDIDIKRENLNDTLVPRLNLNFLSDQSDVEHNNVEEKNLSVISSSNSTKSTHIDIDETMKTNLQSITMNGILSDIDDKKIPNDKKSTNEMSSSEVKENTNNIDGNVSNNNSGDLISESMKLFLETEEKLNNSTKETEISDPTENHTLEDVNSIKSESISKSIDVVMSDDKIDGGNAEIESVKSNENLDNTIRPSVIVVPIGESIEISEQIDEVISVAPDIINENQSIQSQIESENYTFPPSESNVESKLTDSNSDEENHLEILTINDQPLTNSLQSELKTAEELNEAIVDSISPEKLNISTESFQSSTNSIENNAELMVDKLLLSPPPEKPIADEEIEEYENDFSESETFIDDITFPKLDLTANESRLNDQTKNNDDDNDEDEDNSSTSELEQRLIDLDVSLKGLQGTFDRALSPDTAIISPHLTSPKFVHHHHQQNDIFENDKEKNKFCLSPRNYLTNNETATNLMPDIISEVEIRRQQILIENEIKQLEQTVPPYVFMREIPNKPPPPYVPPAHGSPMTIIFPSEERIQEISYRRTKELYDEILKTDNQTDDPITAPPSILDENITNIYERIILDVCQEYMDEYAETLKDLNPETYKNSLALFNPPDRLACMQKFVHQHVRKLLGMEKKPSITSQKNSIFSIGRRKRDNVDEILIQELYEEERKWTNFDREEKEVKNVIIDEIINDIIRNVINEVIDHNNVTSSNSSSVNNEDT